MDTNNRPVPPEGAQTQQYNSMPIPPSSPKKKKPIIAGLAITGVGLCLAGLLLGATPMFVVGGPMELAKQTGYKEPTRQVEQFDASNISTIKIDNDLFNNSDTYSRFGVTYNYEVHLENSENGKIEFEYMNSMGSTGTNHVEKDILQLGIKKLSSKKFDLQSSNLYMLFAQGTENIGEDSSIVVRVPKDWAGTIELPGDYIYAQNFESKGSLVTPKNTQLIRANFENLTLGGDLNIKSQNICLEHARIGGSLEVKDLQDSYSLWLNDVEAPSISAEGGGNFTINNVKTPELNLKTNNYIYGLLPGNSSDYSLDLQGGFYADYYVDQNALYSIGDDTYYNYADRPGLSKDKFISIVDSSILNNNAYAIFDRQEMESMACYAVPLSDIYTSSPHFNTKSDYFDTENLTPEDYKKLEYRYTQDIEGAPKVSITSRSGMVQVGFEGDNKVLGYKTPYLAANTIKSGIEQQGKQEFRNKVNYVSPLNFKLLNDLSDILGIDIFKEAPTE